MIVSTLFLREDYMNRGLASGLVMAGLVLAATVAWGCKDEGKDEGKADANAVTLSVEGMH